MTKRKKLIVTLVKSKHVLTRRDFISPTIAFMIGLIGMTIGIPTIAYLLSPSHLKIEDDSIVNLGDLENYPIGVPTYFEFTRTRVNGWERTATNYGLYIVRINQSEARVLSDICTHLGCRVTWHFDQGHYISPCHDDHFDMKGNVVSGPPPRPLEEFVTKVENGNLFIALPPIKRNA